MGELHAPSQAHASNSADAASKQQRIDSIVRRTSIGAAVLGAVLSPVPLADEIALLPIYAVMSVRIGAAHGLTAGGLPWRAILATAGTGLAARAALNVAVAFIPGVAAAANAASAAALAHVLGRYVNGACADPAGTHSASVADMLAALKGFAKAAP